MKHSTVLLLLLLLLLASCPWRPTFGVPPLVSHPTHDILPCLWRLVPHSASCPPSVSCLALGVLFCPRHLALSLASCSTLGVFSPFLRLVPPLASCYYSCCFPVLGVLSHPWCLFLPLASRPTLDVLSRSWRPTAATFLPLASMVSRPALGVLKYPCLDCP